MSTALLAVAFVAALLSVLSIAGMTAGASTEVRARRGTTILGLLGALVGCLQPRALPEGLLAQDAGLVLLVDVGTPVAGLLGTSSSANNSRK